MPTSSHELIASVVDYEHKAQLRNSSELDTKAGLLLGLSALLVKINDSVPSGWRTASLILFAVGAVLALSSLLIRPGYSIDPNMLRSRYSEAPVEETQVRLLDTRCDQYLRAAQLLSFKTGFFLIGAAASSAAVVVLVIAMLQRPGGLNGI